MSNKMMLLGMLVLAVVGCGDDDDEMTDAGRDAATTAGAAADADVSMDAATTDAATADAAMDGSTADASTADAGDAAGGAFASTLALTTAQEVPPCAAAGAGAMGSGTTTIDAANTTIEVMIPFMNLSGPATAGHIHIGAPGEAGPPVLPFTDLTSPIEETFTAEDYPSSPPAGAPADFAAFLAAMRSGETYVNIHTAACAPGEIRDQIE